MRRVPVVVVAGLAALLLAAGCNDDSGGDGGEEGTASAPPTTSAPGVTGEGLSTEEICTAGEDLLANLDSDGDQARDALLEAAQSGDQAALEQAQEDYSAFVGDFTTQVRAIAGTAADPGLQSALETFADEFEAVADEVVQDPSDPSALDTSELEAATVELGSYCE